MTACSRWSYTASAALAGLFLLLYAQFIAAAQIVVYAGVVMVLYVFVAAYVGAVEEPLWEPIPGQRFLAPMLAAALLVELAIAILGTGLSAIDSGGPTLPGGFGTPNQIGHLLLEQFLWSSKRRPCCSSSPRSARSRSPPGHESATSPTGRGRRRRDRHLVRGALGGALRHRRRGESCTAAARS